MHNMMVRAPERNSLRTVPVDDPDFAAIEEIARAAMIAWADILISRVGRARTKRLLVQMVNAL